MTTSDLLNSDMSHKIGHFRVVPLFQSESWYIAFHMKISFHSHADKTHFHLKGCVPGLALRNQLKLNIAY